MGGIKMSTEETVVGDDTQQVGDSVEKKQDTQTEDSVQPQPSSGDSVAYETHRRLLSEKKKLQEERDQLMRQMQERKETELKEQQKWQDLYKLKEEELTKIKTDLEQRQQQEITATKFSTFLDSLPGQLPKKYWQIASEYVEGIMLNPDTSEPDELSVKAAIEKFKANFGELLQTSSGPKLPSNAPASGGGTLTYEQWRQLPLKEQKQRMGEMMSLDNN
jgi:hypothetical protein